ncbi:RING-H2 finger protein ATL2G [Rhynchospora pubera]|uniref:RING-H2 finger protein ATL2G n=1 Tax=Rhynchospora pubera TaxID=906938 RepID=A0AAV8FH36_9POAL|nr:RING-H2 finger protein ATL2G [Rhynchospora pubera]
MRPTRDCEVALPSGSKLSAWEDILLSLVALVSFFTVACLISYRCSLRLVAARCMELYISDKRQKSSLDSVTIAALPTFTYKSDDNTDGESCKNTSPMECSICLCGVQEGVVVKLLPRCKHSFHATCVDLWLKDHSTCPICQLEVADSASVINPPRQVELEVLDLERQGYTFFG